ncbi:UNVERIFIED_CONTAM: hypothetical protein GTU68_022227 [Idotea baltica]|nr:hypothetical protein [Idotea baltica]
MKGKHFLTVKDFSKEELLGLISDALKIKNLQKQGKEHEYLKNKNLAMVFQKPSTRTRMSFEVGINQLGGKAIYITQAEIGLGERESIADVSRVLSRYVDGVMIRPFYHSDVKEFAKHSSVPVINGLCDLYHPCQVMADMLTIYEKKGTFDGLKLCYIGDGNNVCQSLSNICEIFGIEMTVSCPKGYELSDHENQHAKTIYDPNEAAKDSDVIYTDVWTSMGPNKEESDHKDFLDYTITMDILSNAKKDVTFMHCLPAHRGEEVTNEVLESSYSVVFDQAENRMHAQKAILVALMG